MPARFQRPRGRGTHGLRRRGRGYAVACALLLAAAIAAAAGAPSLVPPPCAGVRAPARGAPGLAAATVSLGAPLAAWAGAPEEELNLLIKDAADKEEFDVLLPPKVDEAPLKISEMVGEAGAGFSSGNVGYGSNAIGDLFTEVQDRLDKVLETGEFPWDQLGAFFFIAVVIANTIAFLTPIFQSYLEEQEPAEATPSPEDIAAARRRAARAAAQQDGDLSLPPREEPDPALPPREAGEGAVSSATASSK